ncbi:hypothetical protein [Eubacterium sp.]|uniref:hypothetical protein n=1 Tax=Eubacterium sp. TaxID=142586 RepID=UPI0026DFF87A|nr:hypothetical protein [Eubacterium sp.]MDO5431783.1 hypothetical protein [Eubacterium sp.]
MHKIISTIGFGILGIDPITAVYMISMGLRKDKKSKISLFWFSFMGFSILIGAVLAAIFGVSAVEILKSLTPEEDSPLWAVLEFVVSLVVVIFVIRKIFYKKEKADENKKAVEGSAFKYLFTGFIFAMTCFTDPTYYAVILLGGESNNFLTATLLFTIWFLVSQFMAVIVYAANQMNLLKKLVEWVERLKGKGFKTVMHVFYAILFVVALGLMADSGYYLMVGKYLF